MQRYWHTLAVLALPLLLLLTIAVTMLGKARRKLLAASTTPARYFRITARRTSCVPACVVTGQ